MARGGEMPNQVERRVGEYYGVVEVIESRW